MSAARSQRTGQGRSVLVTGAAGFIGSHVVDHLLDDGWRVTAIDNFDPFYDEKAKRRNILAQTKHSNYELHEIDICDTNQLKGRVTGPLDAVIHLAARPGVRASLQDPMAAEHVNVGGTASVLELARDLRVPHFVFGSSSSVYGVNPVVPWREDHNVLLPISPYAATKVSGEMLGHAYSHLFPMRFVSLRFFTVYGPRQRPDLAIHKFAKRMLRGERIPLYGKGDSLRDYTYIADIVSGVRAALDCEKEPYTIINLGGGGTVSLAELVELLEEVLGVEALVDHGPEQPGDVPQTWADITKARRDLGYQPRTSLRNGLAAFADWLLSLDSA